LSSEAWSSVAEVVEVVPVRKLDSNLRSWAPVAVAGRDWGGEAPSGVEVPVAATSTFT